MQFYLHRCYVTRRILGIRSRPQTPTLKHPASPTTAICPFSSLAETDVNQRRRVIMIWHISKWHLRHSCKSCTSILSRPSLVWHHHGSQGNTVQRVESSTCHVHLFQSGYAHTSTALTLTLNIQHGNTFTALIKPLPESFPLFKALQLFCSRREVQHTLRAKILHLPTSMFVEGGKPSQEGVFHVLLHPPGALSNIPALPNYTLKQQPTGIQKGSVTALTVSHRDKPSLSPVPLPSQGKGTTPRGYKEALEDTLRKQRSLPAAIPLATVYFNRLARQEQPFPYHRYCDM